MSPSTIRFPPPRSRHPLVRVLRFLWTLPTNLVGHAAGVLVSRGRPARRIAGPAAVATLYPIRLPGVRAIGAVTLGNAILYDPALLDDSVLGRLLLAHELAHTRQHDVLGPLYLPAHIVAQLVCAVLYLIRPAGRDPVHGRNPLEQRWLCLGFDACFELAEGHRLDIDERERLLREFGVITPTAG